MTVPPEPAAAGAAPRRGGDVRDGLARLLGTTRARLAAGLLFALCTIAALAPLLAPYDPAAQLSLDRLQHAAPSLAHPFGTDFFSRDVLSRVMYGARVSLSIGVLSIIVSLGVGTAVGLVSGYAGGRVDGLIMRIVDALLAIPRIFLLLVVIALWESVSVPGLVVILGLTSWFATARIVRGEVLSLKEREYVQAARSLGLGPGRTMLRHVLPNAIGPVIVAGTLGIGQIILIEAGLSYLGLGVGAPTASWGNMIRDGQSALGNAPWVSAFPGLAIVLTVMSLSTLGDRLHEMFDPRSR